MKSNGDRFCWYETILNSKQVRQMPTEDMEVKVPSKKQKCFDKNCLIFQVVPSIPLKKREERVSDACLNLSWLYLKITN